MLLAGNILLVSSYLLLKVFHLLVSIVKKLQPTYAQKVGRGGGGVVLSLKFCFVRSAWPEL